MVVRGLADIAAFFIFAGFDFANQYGESRFGWTAGRRRASLGWTAGAAVPTRA